MSPGVQPGILLEDRRRAVRPRQNSHRYYLLEPVCIRRFFDLSKQPYA